MLDGEVDDGSAHDDHLPHDIADDGAGDAPLALHMLAQVASDQALGAAGGRGWAAQGEETFAKPEAQKRCPQCKLPFPRSAYSQAGWRGRGWCQQCRDKHSWQTAMRRVENGTTSYSRAYRVGGCVNGSAADSDPNCSCTRDMSENESSESADAPGIDAEESDASERSQVKGLRRGCTQASALIARILESSDVPLGPSDRPACTGSSIARHPPIDEVAQGNACAIPQDATSRDSTYFGCYVWKKFEVTRGSRLEELVSKHLLGRVVSRAGGEAADLALPSPRFWIIFSDEQAMCMPVSEIRPIIRTRALGQAWSSGMEKQARKLDHFMRDENIRYRNLLQRCM